MINCEEKEKLSQLLPLPSGWKAIRHVTGLWAYFHPDTNVVTWGRPYTLSSTQNISEHTPDLNVFSPVNAMIPDLDENTPNQEENVDRLSKSLKTICEKAFNEAGLSKPSSENHQAAANKDEGSNKGGTDGDHAAVDEKSPINVLQEYAILNLKTLPEYKFTVDINRETNGVATPYEATVFIQGKKYAFAAGSTRKLAKAAAAEEAVKQLIPGYRSQQREKNTDTTNQQTEGNLTLKSFKKLPVNDPGVIKGCIQHRIKTPAMLLEEYKNRNQGVNVVYNTESKPNSVGPCVSTFEVKVSIGNIFAEGTSSSKKQAKQQAAQNLLCLLYPDAKTYYDIVLSHQSKKAGNGKRPNTGAPSRSTPSNKRQRFQPPVQSGWRHGGRYVDWGMPMRPESESGGNKMAIPGAMTFLDNLKDELRNDQL